MREAFNGVCTAPRLVSAVEMLPAPPPRLFSLIFSLLSSYSPLPLPLLSGVLAPLLEETVFRGFLLTSLTKFMPTWAAIPSSALLFGAAHLSPRDFPVLFSLGCLLGIVYVRSRNLLTPMLVHGVWNSAVLTLLFYLASTGLDIEELIGAMR